MSTENTKTVRLYIDVTYDPEVTDEESVAGMVDHLLEVATNDPDMTSDYGNPKISATTIMPIPFGFYTVQATKENGSWECYRVRAGTADEARRTVAKRAKADGFEPPFTVALEGDKNGKIMLKPKVVTVRR